MQSNESLIAAKRELNVTTTSPGWEVIKQYAEAIVSEKERAAIDEEDDIKGNALRREAKAARAFMSKLFEQIEKAKRFDEPSDNTFLTVVMEEGFEKVFVTN
jgi:hypothetical protein